MKKIGVVVMGSTGSIGTQALNVIEANAQCMALIGIAAGSDANKLLEQTERLRPRYVAMADKAAADSLIGRLPEGVTLLAGPEGLDEMAALAQADVIVMGLPCLAALSPILSALRAGKNVAMANKEGVVCGSVLVYDALGRPGAGRILPVDSEQSAIFQCLQNGAREDVTRVLLTASGGPFRDYTPKQLEMVKPEQALMHPTWRMGRKITIDSATLFNKGLEILEAGYLFHLKKEHISVLIHPQSIVHSMVEYQDGTVMAQLSVPDMRISIQYALTYPARMPAPSRRLSLIDVGMLTFEQPKPPLDMALTLAYAALDTGGSMPVIYNGANEAAVKRFLRGEIRLLDIHNAVAHAMGKADICKISSIEDVWQADAWAKRCVHDWKPTT